MTRYTFDALNRLETVLAPGGGLTTYTYDRSSLKRTVDYPNGTRSRHSYDQARRTLELSHTQGAALIAAYSYGYDANGNRTRQLETNGGSAEETTYSFDATDRLTRVVYPDATVSYTYDAAYNRTGERAVDKATSAVLTDKAYGYNARNQLTQVTNNLDAAQNVTYQFDANGNQTLKSQNGTLTTFVYDVRDKLIAVRQGATTLGQFRYDAAGMRVKKTTQDGEVRYSYDGDSVLAQYDQTGQTLAKYEYGPDQLLSLNHQAEGRQYYHFDALGSVASLTKPDASIQARYQYDAWGNERAQAGASFNRFGYTGHEKDAETGLYYFKARFYDPETGRFLSQDAYLGDVNTAPSLHRYLYAYANPTVYVDPDGHIAWLADLRDGLSEWADDRNNSLSGFTDPSLTDRVVGGMAGVGTGLAHAASGIVGGVNYAANWGSMVTGGFGNEDWAMEHAREISATHDTAAGVYNAVTTEEGRAAIGQQLGEVKDAWMAGDMKATAQITGFFGAVGTGGALTKVNIAGRLSNLGRAAEGLPKGTGATARIAMEAESAPGVAMARAPQAAFGPDSVGAARVPGSFVPQERLALPAPPQRLALPAPQKPAGLLTGPKTGSVGNGPVIIGETMTRVETMAAKTPGAKILNDMPDFKAMGMNRNQVTSAMMQYNRKWILEQIRSDRKIIDIGNDPNRARPSIFYQMEQQMMKNYKKLHPDFEGPVSP